MPSRRTKKSKSSGKFVVTATFRLKSNRISKSEAAKLVARVKAKGGTATVRKA